MPLKLFCKAEGKPVPKYSWKLNGKALVTSSSVIAKDGHLTIAKPSEGEYRCLATNAWGTVMSRPIQVEFAGNYLLSLKI